jgi:hypothetical protein
MRSLRVTVAGMLLASATLGFVAVIQPASADPPTPCPTPGPPRIQCQGCPTYEDPVVCTVICNGGPVEMTFTNACFASCSGYKIRGECTRTGG